MDIHTLLPSRLLFEDPASAKSKLRDICQALEGLGLAGLTAGDHIVHYGLEIEDHIRLQNVHPDIFTLLAMMGAFTERVRIISRILVLPYRQPFAVAHAFASLDRLTNGRAVMGIGAGYARQEFEPFGIPFGERGARTDEYLEIIRLLWRKPKIDYEGRFFSCRDTGLLMHPLQPGGPPVWIGAHNRQAIQRAVRLGDAWTPNCFTYPQDGGDKFGLSLDEFVIERTLLDAQREAIGRERLQCILSAGPMLHITERPQHAGRKRGDIQFFSGTGTLEELHDEFAVFGATRPDAFYVTFTGETMDAYLRNARMFMENIQPDL